jgi:hypothetical protein
MKSRIMKRKNGWERIVDRWRMQLPVPRYLRHSPLQAMRERLWLVSRLQPKIDVTVRVTHSPRIQFLGTAPSTVFLHRWSKEPGAIAPIERPEALMSLARVGVPLTRMSPLAKPRKEPGAAQTAMVAGRMAQPAATLVSAVAQGSTAILRLTNRSRRIDDLTPPPGAQVVRRNALAAVPETASRSRETSGWGDPHRGFPQGEPGVVPPGHTAAAAVNVEQLTDQVLRQLDRRLIASRERLGRI